MTRRTFYIAAAASIAALATPAIAQTPYPSPYPQQGSGSPQQGYGYPQQSYGYGQPGYASSGIGQIIGQLLGNRYNVTDQGAVTQCATAVMSQAAAQYGGNRHYGYAQNGYGYPPQSYGQPSYGSMMRVTAITDVQRRSNGLRVKGLIDSGTGYRGGYGQNAYNGYGNGNYGHGGYAAGDLSFRCNVDYRGAVTDIRISRNTGYGR